MSVAVVIPACGASRRFGSDNKLLRAIHGVALIRRVVDAALASRAADVGVIVRPGDKAVRSALSGADIQFVENPAFDEGMASSIRTGVAAFEAGGNVDVSGLAILPGDQPLMRAEVLDRLISVFEDSLGERVVVPVIACRGGVARERRVEQRNPVIWPRSYWRRLAALEGDGGGKRILQGVTSNLRADVLFTDADPFFDVDLVSDFERLLG